MSGLQDRQAACLKAAGYRKPTKKDLLERIDELLDEGPSELFDPKLIGMVWLYFERQPSAKAARSDAHWVAQAVSTDEDRPWIWCVRTEPGKLIATDGHRMHLATDQNVVSQGYLDATTLKPVEAPAPGMDFPPYEQILPAMPENAELVKLTDFTPVDRESVEVLGIRLNRRYVREAFAGSDAMRFGHDGPLDPVRLESLDGKRVAVIMPMRP
jgi:hypothetical protein